MKNLLTPAHFLSLTALLVGLATPPHASGTPPASCSALRFPDAPTWISSLAWEPNSKGLVIADPVGERLLLYSPATQTWTRLELADASNPLSQGPLSVTPVDGRIFVELSGASAGFLDEQLRLADPLPRWVDDPTDGGRTGTAGTIASMLTNWVEHDGRMIGYGAINALDVDVSRQHQRPTGAGILIANFDRRNGSVSNGLAIDRDTPHEYYRLGYPYFAANHLGLHYVRMKPGQPATVLRVGSTSVSPVNLAAVPPAFSAVPVLTSPNTGTASPLAIIAQKTVVAGLYGGAGDELYLLTREPIAGGVKTRWQLHKLSANGRFEGAVTLPSSAMHLSILRAPDDWFVIERNGTGQSWGRQRIDTILQIPASWIEAPLESPLAAASIDANLCRPRTTSPKS